MTSVSSMESGGRTTHQRRVAFKLLSTILVLPTQYSRSARKRKTRKRGRRGGPRRPLIRQICAKLYIPMGWVAQKISDHKVVVESLPLLWNSLRDSIGDA